MGAILEIKSGPFAGQTIPVQDGQEILIGRTERAHFAFPHDSFMSGVHFALQCGPQGCRVVDRKSSNGTSVNGTKVTEALARDGDEIRAGQTVFILRIVPAAAPAPTPASMPPPAPVPSPPEIPATPTITRAPVLVVGSWAFGTVPEGWAPSEGFGIRRTGKGVFPSEVVATEEQLSGSTTFKQYVESQVALLRQFISSPQIEVAGPVTVAGAEEAVAIVVRYKTEDGRRFVQRQIYARRGQLAGVITLTTLETDLPQVQPAFDAVLAALIFGCRK